MSDEAERAGPAFGVSLDTPFPPGGDGLSARHYGTLLQGSGDAIRGKLYAYLEGLGQESPAAEGQA
jgi:hypothetical protein